ncbi:acyl-CoA N-acyltransferase [Chytriomyces cf. hyalinus JEL632]|nr:acyl-CoA N-acyltransferase [Chytriomyces cf. hyalinus JEL632]
MFVRVSVPQKDAAPLSLAVTEWTPAMAPSLIKHLNGTDGTDVTRFLRNKVPQPYTEDDARFFIGLTAANGLFTAHAIVLLDSDSNIVEAIGTVGLTFKDPTDIEAHSAELGYWLSKAWWGKGIMRSVVCEYLDKVARPLSIVPRNEQSAKLVKIIAYAIADNAGSCKVLENSGFALEGKLRQFAFKRGTWSDGRLYAYFL